jgi:cytochrome c-type biogenesis protein CcmH
MFAATRIIVVLLALVAVPVSLSATDIEREARVIEDLLMAPCCFRQQVSVHLSPTATEVRRDIRVRLTAGETRQMILDAYVAEHGTGVLVVPPAKGSNLVLYVLPPITLAGSVLFVVGIVRRFSLPGTTEAATPAVVEDPRAPRPLEEQLTDELRDLD